MAHREESPSWTSRFNVPLSTGENARKKIDVPKNIGFRGRHAHGKAPDDPVYPSRQLGPSPRIGFVDWRTGGRALLVAAMAMIEGKSLRSRSSILQWQRYPTCSPSCGWTCHKAKNRVLCAWFTPGTVHEHLARMDGLLTKFKGAKEISIQKPPVRPMSQVAMRNRKNAIQMRLLPDGKLERLHPLPDPAFGIDPEQKRTIHPEDDGSLDFVNGYDSDEDPEAQGEADLDLALYDSASKREAEFISSAIDL